MKQTAALLFSLLGVICSSPQPIFAQSSSPPVEEPSWQPPGAEELGALVEDFLRDSMDEADVPGLAVAVVRSNEVLLLQGHGYAEVEGEVAVDPERTLFRLGSIAKTVTATVVLSAISNAELGLDDDVRPLLSGLDLRQITDRPITLRQLLTHTAGYSENLFGQHVAEPGSFLGLRDYLERRLPPSFAPPGEVIAYTDFHTSLAGLAVAELTGRDFTTLAEERVFRPLGMDSTSFRQVDLPDVLLDRFAFGYRRVGGSLLPYRRDFIQTVPAAGLQSTAADMALYLRALLAEAGPLAESVLEPAAWREQKTVSYRADPRLLGKALGLTETRHGGRRFLYKNGQASGFNARLVLHPEEDIAVFSVHNRSILEPMGSFNRAARIHENLGWTILDAWLPSLDQPAAPPEPLTTPARSLERFEGSYRTTVCSRHTAEKIISMMDGLRVRRRGDRLDLGFGPLVQVAPGVFQWHEGGSFHVAFSDDDDPSQYAYLGAGAYERIPWFETPELTRRAAIFFLAFFTLALVVGLGLRVRLRKYRQDRGRIRRVHGALAVAALDLAFLVAFGAVLATVDIQFLFQGWPLSIRLALALPLLSVLPLVYLWVELARAGLNRSLSPFEGVLGVSVALSGSLFLVWLNVWNLLGWRL